MKILLPLCALVLLVACAAPEPRLLTFEEMFGCEPNDQACLDALYPAESNG